MASLSPRGADVGQASTFTCPLSNIADRVGADLSARSPAGREHMDGVRWIPARGQVGYKRLADISGQ